MGLFQLIKVRFKNFIFSSLIDAGDRKVIWSAVLLHVVFGKSHALASFLIGRTRTNPSEDLSTSIQDKYITAIKFISSYISVTSNFAEFKCSTFIRNTEEFLSFKWRGSIMTTFFGRLDVSFTTKKLIESCRIFVVIRFTKNFDGRLAFTFVVQSSRKLSSFVLFKDTSRGTVPLVDGQTSVKYKYITTVEGVTRKSNLASSDILSDTLNVQ
mmetsp:Transcript_25493/g.32465  ORF Transcript_25493/g.32465 Transcript_25493/m.32465 type:complete len:212 (-) Transcript_25493:502-1137(-)